MTIFEFNAAEIPDVLSALGNFIIENPILCTALFISYALYYVYMFMNNKAADSEVYEIDLLSAGISSIMISLLLIGLDESSKSISFASLDFGSPNTKVALFLFIYSIFMIVFAFSKKLPRFFVVLFGNSEVDLFINFVAILLTDSDVSINGTLLAVIAVPLTILLIIQRIRRKIR